MVTVYRHLCGKTVKKFLMMSSTVQWSLAFDKNQIHKHAREDESRPIKFIFMLVIAKGH